jgi:hypothetical protein
MQSLKGKTVDSGQGTRAKRQVSLEEKFQAKEYLELGERAGK